MIQILFEEDFNRALPETLLEYLRDGRYESQVEQIRMLANGSPTEINSALVRFSHLPKYIPAGEFIIHAQEPEFVSYTKIVALEFLVSVDEELASLSDSIKAVPFTYVAYLNAFSNGFVVWVKTDTPMSSISHSWTHIGLSSLYRKRTGFSASHIGNDWTDALEVSFDAGLFLNPKAEIYPHPSGIRGSTFQLNLFDQPK
jgi:hypothetical protein